MFDTVNGLLIFLVALIPGVPGEAIYSRVVGLDWREDRLRRTIRIAVISTGGLILYILLADCWSLLSPPEYVIPSHLAASMTIDSLTGMAWAYTGHTATSLFVGVVLGLGRLGLANIIGTTVEPSTWDDLLSYHVPNHWVVVTLNDGTAYAGLIETADRNVPAPERDVLLAEPARYDPDQNQYVAEFYQHLFIPAALIASVAVIHNPETDKRVTPIGESPFIHTELTHGEGPKVQPDDGPA